MNTTYGWGDPVAPCAGVWVNGQPPGCCEVHMKRWGHKANEAKDTPAAPPAAPSGDASAPAPDRDARPGRPSDQP